MCFTGFSQAGWIILSGLIRRSKLLLPSVTSPSPDSNPIQTIMWTCLGKFVDLLWRSHQSCADKNCLPFNQVWLHIEDECKGHLRHPVGKNSGTDLAGEISEGFCRLQSIMLGWCISKASLTPGCVHSAFTMQHCFVAACMLLMSWWHIYMRTLDPQTKYVMLAC